MRIVGPLPVFFLSLLATACNQESTRISTGDIPDGELTSDQRAADGTLEISPLDAVDVLDICVPDCGGKACGDDGCGGPAAAVTMGTPAL